MPVEVKFAGRLTDTPEVRFTSSGIAVANFNVAINDRTKNAAGEWVDGEPTFLRCNAWRDMGENVAETLDKGSLVVVTGKLRQRKYETKEGEKRSVYEVEVDDIGPSLKWKDKNAKPKASSSSYSDDVPF